MANSCSYYGFNNERRKDDVCFSSFNQNNYKTIIVEKNKQMYPLEELLYYLDQLMTIGTKIKSYEIKGGEILITREDDTTMLERKFFGIVIRFMWEGKYVNDNDTFYKIFDHFMRMCKFYPEVDRYILLSIAHNIYLVGRHNNFSVNTNHLLVNRSLRIETSEELQKALSKTNTTQISEALAANEEIVFTDGVKERENYVNKEQYDAIFKELNMKL